MVHALARLWAVLLVLASLVLAGTVPAGAETGGLPAAASATVLIFDGSGSMWGRLDGDKKAAKLDLAREAVRQTLGRTPVTARIGLMSFGHRRSGDCSDVELIAPVEAGDAAHIMTPLDKLNPRGKGPITGALREAAEALAGEPGGTIVLIHDNADNCRQDPCEAAGEIVAAAPGLRVHLVSLGLEREELARVACIAKVTGGRQFDVRDAVSLSSAVGEALALAVGDPGSPAAGAANTATAKAEPNRPPAAPSGPPGLRLTAKLAPGSAPVGWPVRWRVLRADGEPPVFEGAGADVTALLPAGSYIVEANAGFVTRRATTTASEQGPTPFEFALDASVLRVISRDQKEGPAVATTLVTLRPAGPAGGRPLWIGSARDAEFVLAPGSYRVRFGDGLAEREEMVAVAAGETKTLDTVRGVGRLELSATAKTDGDPLDGVTFLLARDDPDAADGRREIARSAAVRPNFILPAGTYYVTARSGAAEVRQRVAVGAGDTVKRAVVLGLTKVTVVSELASPRRENSGQSGANRPAVTTRVLSLDGEPHEVARSTSAAPEFTLAAGRYRFEAVAAPLEVRAVQESEIEPGGSRRIALKFDANTVTVKLGGSSLGAAADRTVICEVRDAKGALQVRAQPANSPLVLTPGRYVVRCDSGDRRLEKSVDVAADGQPRVVEFALP